MGLTWVLPPSHFYDRPIPSAAAVRLALPALCMTTASEGSSSLLLRGDSVSGSEGMRWGFQQEAEPPRCLSIRTPGFHSRRLPPIGVAWGKSEHISASQLPLL